MDNIVKPWHGIPREEIQWHPEAVCRLRVVRHRLRADGLSLRL
jgi:hypothetical protein